MSVTSSPPLELEPALEPLDLVYEEREGTLQEFTKVIQGMDGLID